MKNQNTTAKRDLFAEVTDRIIAALESGIIPWHKPWIGVTDCAISYATGKPYSLLNQILLEEPGEYITFNACRKAGGHVKKGAKAKMVVFWKMVPVKDTDKDGNVKLTADGLPMVKSVPILKYDQVFNLKDCEGVEPRNPEQELTEIEPIEAAEATLTDYVTRSGVTLIHEKQNRAFYRPSTDMICLPLREQFEDPAEYYATAFHEATHSTGHPSRLNRLVTTGATAAFGGEDYSKEELVAEIGSATIMNRLGIETSGTFQNSAAYIQGWLKALRNDKKLIVSAAGKAEKAVALIFGD